MNLKDDSYARMFDQLPAFFIASHLLITFANSLVLIYIQTGVHSDSCVPERIFEKVNFKKSQQTTTKA